MLRGILVFFRSFREVGVRIPKGHLTLYVWCDYVILYLFGIYDYYNSLTLLHVVYYMYYIIVKFTDI